MDREMNDNVINVLLEQKDRKIRQLEDIINEIHQDLQALEKTVDRLSGLLSPVQQ